MRRPRPSTLVCVLCVMLLPLTIGCGLHRCCTPKGPMNQQQAQAIVHDPFPQMDIGPFDAATRPPGYEQPLPEAERNRFVADAIPGFR